MHSLGPKRGDKHAAADFEGIEWGGTVVVRSEHEPQTRAATILDLHPGVFIDGPASRVRAEKPRRRTPRCSGLVTVRENDIPGVRLVAGLLLRPPGELLAVRAEAGAAVGGGVVARQALPLGRA